MGDFEEKLVRMRLGSGNGEGGDKFVIGFDGG